MSDMISSERCEVIYPGSQAEVAEIMELAESYYEAAQALFTNARKRRPLSYAPARLCSIHAIELYLNAFLRRSGETPEKVRARMHNLADETFWTCRGLMPLL